MALSESIFFLIFPEKNKKPGPSNKSSLADT